VGPQPVRRASGTEQSLSQGSVALPTLITCWSLSLKGDPAHHSPPARFQVHAAASARHSGDFVSMPPRCAVMSSRCVPCRRSWTCVAASRPSSGRCWPCRAWCPSPGADFAPARRLGARSKSRCWSRPSANCRPCARKKAARWRSCLSYRDHIGSGSIAFAGGFRISRRLRDRLHERVRRCGEHDVKIDRSDLIKKCRFSRSERHLGGGRPPGEPFDQFQEIMKDGESPRAKLEFLTQEMSRETNTIGSRRSDVEIPREVDRDQSHAGEDSRADSERGMRRGQGSGVRGQ